MVESCGPLLKGAVGGNDDRPLFIAQRDDLEEQIGARLVNWEVPKLVEDKQRGFRVFFEFGFETPGALCCGEGVDHLNGTGKKHRMALEAGGIAQRGRQVGFAQADAAEEDEVGLVLDKRQAEVVLHLEAVNPGGPVPAELL